MKRKRNVVILILIFLFIIGSISFIIMKKRNNPIINEEIKSETIDNVEITEGLEFLNAISGVKAENLEIINNPVIGVRGKIFAPKIAILNGINYFLDNTNNDKMKNIELDIQNNSIDIYVNYAVTDKIDTPIKVNITPSLNNNNDLVIDIVSVKILDLKLADFFVNLALKTFVKDWFISSDIKVEYENSKVILSKENFNGITLNSILVKDDGISLDMIIEAEKLIK